MKKTLIAFVFVLSSVFIAQAQQNYLITKNSVGNLRLGMTVAQARKVLKGINLHKYVSGDGSVMIQVTKNGEDVMHLFTGEEDPDSEINEKAKIEFIEVFDANYKTVDGIRPTMLVKNAEKILGGIERVFISEIEAREFVVFRKKPKNLTFRVAVNRESGEYMDAGIYPDNEREGVRCVPTAYILSVQVFNSW